MKQLENILQDYEDFCLSYDQLLRAHQRIMDSSSSKQNELLRNNEIRMEHLQQRMTLLSERYHWRFERRTIEFAHGPTSFQERFTAFLYFNFPDI